MQFVPRLMFHSWRSVGQRLDSDRKAAKVILLTPVLVPVPAIEVSEDRNAMRARSPFQKRDVAIGLLLQTVLAIGPSNLVEAALCSLENIKPSD